MSIVDRWPMLFACTLVVILGAALPIQAATIRGVVTFTGLVESKKLPVTIDQYVCGKEKDSEDLVVGRERGLRNAVVWLQTPPPGAVAAKENPLPKVELDQRGCLFIPRVVIVP